LYWLLTGEKEKTWTVTFTLNIYEKSNCSIYIILKTVKKAEKLHHCLKITNGFYTNKALGGLEKYIDTKPFFRWLNLTGPHGPHDVPQKYHDMDHV